MAVTIKVGETGSTPVSVGEKMYIKGDQGFSPTVSFESIPNGTRVIITDVDGPHSFNVFNGEGVGIESAVMNDDYTLTLYFTDGTSYTTPSLRGEQGATGPTGETGSDGATFTPSVSSAGIISWTNDGGKTNPDPVDIKGPQGQDGTDGEDGFSPTVSVTAITGGHRVSVTDATGTDNFDVMDGVDGATGPAGPGVPAGGTTGMYLRKKSGTDYDGEWANIPEPTGYVSYASTQSLTDAQKKRARDNIGAVQGWETVWTNPDITADFTAQTVSADLSAYSEILVTFTTTFRTERCSMIIPTSSTDAWPVFSFGNLASSGTAVTVCKRTAQIVSGGVQFSGTSMRATTPATSAVSTRNDVNIPVSIEAR